METAQQNDSTAERADDGYEEFQEWVGKNFAVHTEPLFTTDAAGLYDAYLMGLPEDARQHYTCNACRRFIERYGGLVVIAEDGVSHSAIWGAGSPEFFRNSVHKMRRIVEKAKVNGVFVSSKTVYGEPVTGDWHHLSCEPVRGHVWRGNITADQRSAQLGQDYQMVISGLLEYSIETVAEALKVLETDAVYRSDKFDEPMRWLYDLHYKRHGLKGSAKENITWLYVATSPDGFHHIKSAVTASLMDDIKAGLPFNEIKARFETKVRPENYQRATVAPKEGSKARANEIMDQLGSAGALSRRYAVLGEISQFIWLPSTPKHVAKNTKTGGTFDHIPSRPSRKAQPAPAVSLPPTTLTWSKFLNSVLPTATSIEAKIPVSSSRFMAVVTAADPEAAPILAWDYPEQRNPFSWYYGAGIDGEFKKRVEGAGGQYENVDIRATLIWSNRNDLDLHCVTPHGEHIYYGDKRSQCGGWLDIDMNVHGETTTPVENIRWGRGKAHSGRYRFYVQNFRFHESSNYDTHFRVEVQVGEQTFTFDGVIPAGYYGPNSNYDVFTFDYVPGRPLPYPSNASAGVGDWNMIPGAYAPVTAILPSPNLWGDNPQVHHGQHIFFVLDGCRDTKRNHARGFFVESLKNEYREIRSVIDAYNATAEILGSESGDVCGLGMTNNQPWGLVLRVTSGLGMIEYNIDRWD